MAFSPPSFLDLPTELKFIILSKLDARSLVRMGMTNKSINELIYASHECNLALEMAKSEFIPAANIGSSAITRRAQVNAHLTSRLTLPLETRHCDLIVAPTAGIVMERLFQGLFACIAASTLHVWDIRLPDPTRPPPKILMISETRLLDVVISPHHDLLVLLCHHAGYAALKFMKLSSNGTQPHPLASSPLIILPDQSMSVYTNQHFLTLYGPLLALVYRRRQLRRGMIWDWRTGDRLYDSVDFDSTSKFHDLRLLTSSSFLVTASTPSINGPPADFRGWIELHRCGSSAPSRLIAEFRLPEFDQTTEFDLEALEFYSSEQITSSNIFPFVSDTGTNVQVLQIWYNPRPGSTFRADSRVYLVISNKVFAAIPESTVPEGLTLLPLHIEWDDWGPPWTSMWEYGDLGMLVGMSSVCGSRICSVSHPTDCCIELLVVDFNMNLPCVQRNCTNPLVHLSPKLFRMSDGTPLWARVVHTWLPFHTQCKRITIPRTDGDWDMCTTVLMDEERIILSTCASESPTVDPTCWRIVHMLCDRQNNSHLLPWSEDIEVDDLITRATMQHDEICRLCREEPHTDSHILLGCIAHPKVVQLRQNLIKHIRHHYPALFRAWCWDSFGELLDGIKAHWGAQMRILISSLVTEIRKIYENLPPCSELVLVDQDNPVDTLFVVM